MKGYQKKTTLKSKKSQSGFTLIELLIAVGLLGVLVAVFAPNFVGGQRAVNIGAAPTEITDRIANTVAFADSANTAAGCLNLTTASLTAANNGNALVNIFGQAVTVTAATQTSLTVQYPTPDAATAAAVQAKVTSGLTTAVAGVNVTVTYTCFA